MLTKSVQEAINEQIKHEFFSAYLYLAMSAYFDDQGLTGFSAWMRMQAQEEVVHGMRLFDYAGDRGGRVVLHAIGQPPSDFGSPLKCFEAALTHEQEVTASIHELYALAVKEKDYPTQVQLQWFITEQVEEEKSAGDIVDKLRLAGDQKAALLLLDRDLGARQTEKE
jgi:ferritin